MDVGRVDVEYYICIVNFMKRGNLVQFIDILSLRNLNEYTVLSVIGNAWKRFAAWRYSNASWKVFH